MKGVFEDVADAYNLVSESLEKAKQEQSNLADGTDPAKAILGMFGMSGKMWRHFLNNLMSVKNIRYLQQNLQILKI